MIAKVARGVRRHWLRLVLGGALVWLVGFLFWLPVITWVVPPTASDYDVALTIYVALIVSWPLGALWAWMRR